MTVRESCLERQRKSFFSSINGRNIYIQIDGAGPAMVMTHGLGASANVFQPLVEIFSPRFTVVRFDWPGLGLSGLTKGQPPLSVPGFLEDLEGVLDLLEIESAILVGHSLGGSVSMHLAAKTPARVSGLVIIGAGRPRVEESQSRTATLKIAEIARREGLWLNVDDRVSTNIPPESPALARALLRQVTGATDPEGYAQVCDAMCHPSYVDPDYYRITMPTCIIGSTKDKIVAPEVAYELQGLIGKNGNVPDVHIMNGGHMMIIEDVEGVASIIDGFLAKI
ncbi:uncharacterized protein DNG_10401 [Cephalotrichum gorgonifer]|uniref:AB hydrolase-1 domain-containing protein n=1 Tax=Cephalotrichum gorgonifer TaxID=2041049 RepID=A0AAE8N7K3_9PEZI|nr:uncharacterized protein DNG_10401 [Cephalotrichum gorgonifer]